MGLSPWEDVLRTFMIPIQHWPLTSRSIYKVYDVTFCPLTKSYYVWHKSVSPCYDLSHTFMTLTFDLNIKVIFSPWIWVWQDHLLLFDIPVGIPNFGILVYHNETTCCVHSWNLYDLDLWPLCGWRGVCLVSFTHSFYLVKILLLVSIGLVHMEIPVSYVPVCVIRVIVECISPFQRCHHWKLGWWTDKFLCWLCDFCCAGSFGNSDWPEN